MVCTLITENVWKWSLLPKQNQETRKWLHITSVVLKSLTLCKYNLCSLHFPVCHLSWDSKKWKLDKNMKNKDWWITCAKVSAPPPPQIVFLKMYPLPEKLLSFSSVQGKTLNLPPFCPLLFLWIRKNIFAIFFLIWRECKFDPKMIKSFLSASFSNYIWRREKCPPPKKSNKIQRNPMIVLSGKAYALSYACEETTLHAITSLCIFPTKTILHF